MNEKCKECDDDDEQPETGAYSFHSSAVGSRSAFVPHRQVRNAPWLCGKIHSCATDLRNTPVLTRNSFRATAPPFLDYLRGVLRRYPDGGQILKELVQNADDAGATEVVFISDERTFDVESLWSDKMGRYQGPALFAFNNAVFTDEDWQGIQSSGRSVKRDNPNKVGRFGIGFNSVYHLTDLPCIFSAKNLAMFDPQKSVFENEGFMWNLDFEEDRVTFLNLHNQFQPFKEVLNHVCDYSWEDIISRDQHFNGTLFRFPLRSEPSAIADNKYDSAKISQLFSSFIKDVDLCLLFLRNVNKVLLLHIDPEGSASIRLNVTASNRKLCSSSLKRDLKVEGSTCLRSINSLCPDKEETKTQWVVTETHIKQGKAPELDSLSKRLSLHPEVSLAFPVEGERVLTSGRLSCFLPLPNNEQNTTGLPLHVHASFGLTDNRRDVKWQEEDQKYDEVALWNELILKEVLPSAYILLILDVVDLCSYSNCFPASTVYHIWPDLASLEHKKRWQMIALDTARHLLHLDVLCLAEDETQWVKPTEAVFPPDDNTDPFIKQAVSDYLISSGVKLVYTPPSVRRSIEEAARVQCKTITKATGEYVRNIIRTAIPADSSKEMRLALLEYVLDDRKYSELEELQLLPLSDGSFTAFSKQIEKVVFMDSDEFPRLNQPIVEQLCASSLPKDWQKSRDHVTWEIGNSLHPSARWLREFWRFLNTHVKDLKNYVGLPLIPLDVIYDHTQVVQLARLEENTTLMFGVSQHGCLSEELISLLERVGATIIIRKDECLRHENLVNYILTPSPRNVMQILLNLEIAEVIDGVNSAPSREKESLKTFLASLDSFSENESNLLSKLHLFRSLPNIKGDGSNYLPADSLPAIDLSPIPAIPSHLLMPDVILKCETEADRRLLSLLNVKLLKSPQVANLLVLGIEQAVYGKEDVNNIMHWILESGSVLFALENSLSRTCVNLCFMEIHGGKKAKASDLFDPKNETFQALLQDDFFPPFPFRNEQILESLRRLGMKTKVEDLEPLDILHIATDISSSYKNSPEGAFAKAKELIKLCNQASVLTKFSDSQMDKFLNTQWFPCDNVCTDPTAAQCTIFCEPKDIRDSSYINLVGFVMPLTNRVHGEARERLGLMRRPPAIKVFENLSALRMISQASQDSNADTKFKENLHSIYRFLQDEMKFDVTIKTLSKQYKDTPLLWVRDDFLIPSNVVFGYPQGLDLSSCIPQVPEEFLQYKKLLKEFGVKEGLTDNEIVGLLYTIKNKIYLREPPCGTCIEREVVINILNWMCREKKTAQDDLPVPVMTENCAFNLQRKCSAVFCDITSDSMAELQDENGKVYIVLEEVPKATAVELKIPLLSTQILKPEHIRFEQCGQTEPITRRIRNILEEYDDENDLFKELIQNAEDAGAKTCRFMLDYRENQELNGLIDPGMALCQGPCLWAFNDETFTEEDWINIVKVGARSKEQKVEKIGQFGLGFNAVYHVTDIPSVLSNRKLLILDPNVTHLPKHIQSRANPGIKIDFGRERVLSSFPGQFRSYEGIFNWKSGQLPYVGTLIKLPFRTENEAKMSEISKKFYTENSIVAFENHLSQNSDTLLLFLKNIKEVTLQILSKNSSFPPKNDQIQSLLRISKKQLRIIEIPEDMRKVQISTMQSLMSLNHKCGNIIECHSANLFEITVENKGSCSIQHWLQYSCFGLEKANEVVKNQSHQDFSLPVGGVAIPLRYDQTLGCCVPHSVNTAGGVYCFLPLSVHSGLPVHINGTFSVTSNRKTLWDTGSKHKWNEDLLRESVTTAYITALLVLKDMAQDESLQTYLYFEFWPDIQKVSKAFQTLASAFYSAVIQGFHGRSLELFSDGTNWCSMDNARFLHPNIEKNEHIGQIAKDMFQKTRNKTFLAVPLPEWVRNGFIQTGHKDTVENNTFHWLELYKEVIFPNLADMDLKSRDILILHAIDVNDEQIDTLLKKHPCIPTHKGLRHINELVNPYGKAACLYEPHEGRILEGTENDFLSPKRVRRLIELGLMNDQLPFHEIIERAKKIKDIWMYDKRKADQKYKCIMDMSSNLLQENFRRFPSLQKFHNSVSPDWTLLGNVAFIPARLLFKQGLEHDDEIVLKRPNEIYKYKSRHLVGMTQYFVEDNNISSLHGVVLQKLGVAEEPSPQVVCRQLCRSLEYSKGKPEGTVTAILFENANQCYKYLEESLARNKGNLKLREMAQQFPTVFIDNIFVDAEKVAKTVKFDARPYLYKLPNEFAGFKHLWNCTGVKEHFTQKDYLEVLQNLKERYQNNPLSPSDLDICLQIVTKGLYRQHEFKQGDCLLPDENCVLRNSSQLYYNDTKWLPSPDDLLLCHEYIPRSIAVNLKVPTTRDLTLQEHLIDEQFFNFEQKEKLTVRLKNIISAYPSKRDILKELIQNADDAQATEIHFIWDPRHHKTEKTCGDHWNYLQGPALCVYNNKVFSETDLDGIQQIGEGGKHGTIGTTGKFGLGFNSVYHLTDCPSLLTGDEKLCISDPNKFVLKETGKVGEGYKVTQKFKDSFPDVYNTYLPSFFHLDCGTMFRLPVRTQEMAQRSEISREHVTIKDIQQLCASLVEDPDSLVLFLRHIKKIAFHQISENELKPVFTTEIHMSDECSTKKHDIQTCLHSGKDNGGSGVPFQTIYRMDIQSKGKDTSHWIVAEKVGSKGTKYDSRLPQVGVAACLGKEISGRAFCSLPLPGNTGLPVHINGNFEVDSSRRCLWKEDGMSNKVKWNEFLMQDFIAPLYGDLLDYIRTHCLCSPEEYPSLHELSKHIESGYLAFFPHVSDNTAQEWKEMVLRLYRHIKERQLMLIPVFQIHNPVNAQSKAKSFTLTWSTICGAKLTDAPHLVSNFKECFLEVLDSVGMNLVPLSDSTAKLWSNFKEAGIQVQSVSPPKVREYLKAEVVNDVGFFVKFIMPTIDNFSEPQVLSAIKALLAIQQHKDYNKYRPHILSKFRQLRFIKDMHGNFQIPSYFYDEEQDFFKIMLPDERFIPNSFWSSIHCAKNRLKKLLVDLGLKKNVSSQDCIEFALQIQRSIAGKTSTEILKRRAKAVLDWILNRKQNEFDEDFFDQISDIKFVFPQKIPEPLCNLHQPFAAEGVTVSIRGSLIENNRFDKELIWTSMPVLPLQCTTKSVCDILSACGAVNGPPTECIFKNLRNICHAPCLTPDLVKTRSSVLHSSYAFLQSADYNVSSLSDLPLVLVEKGTVLVKPSNTVLSLTDDTDFRPYLYSLPFKLIIYKEFFKKVGVEETPSVKHYSKVLNDVHEDSSNKQTLNANQMKTVRRAVQKLLRMLEKHPEQRAGLHIPLYLPAVDGRLYNSQSLYFNDTVFQPKRWEESINATLQLLEKLNMCYLGNDPYEHKKLVQSLPEKIRPKMLSQLVREDLQKSSMITCEYGEFCEFRENFHRHLSASYFMHGIIAVIRHQYKGAVSQDQAISICKKIFTSIKIICCKTLDTVLVLDGKPLENSTEENPIYVDRDNESCTFFLKHSDDLSLKTMNEINLRIATMINVLFQKCLNSDSVLIIAQLLCCDNLDDVQRVLEKNGIYDSTTGEAEYDKLPVPGSIIPEEWIDSLDMYFLHNFEKGEYVGVKMPPDDNEVYYYAKIIDRVNALSDQQGPATSRYRVQIGPDKEIQAGSLDIYKFIRTGTSSDHSARSCKNLVFIGHLAQVQHPQTADRVQQLSLEEIKKDIDRCLREIWTLPEEERHKAVRRLYLKWHPDKNPNCAELATEAFKYVQKRIQELEEGKMKCRSGASNKDYPKQTRNYRKFYQQWNQQASSHRRGRERFQEQHSSEGYDFWKFHGHSTPKPDQRAREAQRWLKQAKRDLDGANNDFGRGFTEWCLFKIHQAVEKCLVSVEYKRNGQLPANRTISSLAQKVAGYSPKLSSVPNMVNRLQKLGVDAKRTQYPNYHPLPCIPNEQFPSENEPQAMSLASELLAQVNEYITD
ncbi:sacsin-like [Chanos chanos]|uniref:Sacsin-like n=1 Tax=Chanos chanos TaxID=29144 RepID=A0A6J2V9S3_CHACN|nr:sacsin-like [Chanos chanos]